MIEGKDKGKTNKKERTKEGRRGRKGENTLIKVKERKKINKIMKWKNGARTNKGGGGNT